MWLGTVCMACDYRKLFDQKIDLLWVVCFVSVLEFALRCDDADC